MNKSFVVVCAVLCWAGAIARAQVIGFPVKIRGAVTFPQGSNAVAKLAVTEANLVAAGDSVVLVVDGSGHSMELDEYSGTNFVKTLMGSSRLAIEADRNFSAAMTFHTSVSSPLGSFLVEGDVNFTGKVTPRNGDPKSINATIAGVLNDNVDGIPGSGDIILKGKLSRNGNPFFLSAP